MEAARRRLSGGAGTRTDIDEAQARLDLAFARELEARENLGFTRRQLQQVTGVANGPLVPLEPAGMPLLPPEPADIDSWIARAEQGSPQLRALQAQRDAASHEISKQESGHLPTLDAVAQKVNSLSDNVTRLGFRFDHKSIGLELNVPLFAGGYVSSKVRQAIADLERVEQSMEATRRELGLRVYKEFRGVVEGVLRVRALEQAVRSSEAVLQSTRRSYEAGSRTQVDVLNAEEDASPPCWTWRTRAMPTCLRASSARPGGRGERRDDRGNERLAAAGRGDGDCGGVPVRRAPKRRRHWTQEYMQTVRACSRARPIQWSRGYPCRARLPLRRYGS